MLNVTQKTPPRIFQPMTNAWAHCNEQQLHGQSVVRFSTNMG